MTNLTTMLLLGAADETKWLSPWPVVIMIAVMFYMMFIAPDRRKRAEHNTMLENMKKNDQVVTIGGIKGTITNVKGDEVTIRIDESNNTRIRVQKSAISRIDMGESTDKSID